MIRRFVFCGTLLEVTLTGRYPAPCPAELGLSSRPSDKAGGASDHLRCCDGETIGSHHRLVELLRLDFAHRFAEARAQLLLRTALQLSGTLARHAKSPPDFREG